MKGQEPDLRKVDAIVLLFVTIVMFVVGYTRSLEINSNRTVLIINVY
jgi:hypothetical protein